MRVRVAAPCPLQFLFRGKIRGKRSLSISLSLSLRIYICICICKYINAHVLTCQCICVYAYPIMNQPKKTALLDDPRIQRLLNNPNWKPAAEAAMKLDRKSVDEGKRGKL